MKKIIIIIIASIIIGGGFWWWQQNTIINDVSQQPSLTENNNSKQTLEKELYKVYQDDQLKISFSYPKDWGEINKNVEFNNNHIGLIVLDDLFFSADNGGENVARGAYWGDYAQYITDQDYIDNFCDDKDGCEIKTNKNNITFAREKKIFSSLQDPDPRESIFYYLFNPKSEFRGIIVSNERMIDNNIELLELKMDQIIDSLEFID